MICRPGSYAIFIVKPSLECFQDRCRPFCLWGLGQSCAQTGQDRQNLRVIKAAVSKAVLRDAIK